MYFFVTESKNYAQYKSITVYSSTYKALKHTVSGSDEKAFMKLIVDDASDKVVGFAIFVHGSKNNVTNVLPPPQVCILSAIRRERSARVLRWPCTRERPRQTLTTLLAFTQLRPRSSARCVHHHTRSSTAPSSREEVRCK